MNRLAARVWHCPILLRECCSAGWIFLGSKCPNGCKRTSNAQHRTPNAQILFSISTLGVGRLLPAVKKEHPRIPTCTYRLQFNQWFTFAQACEIVPYLHALGVSDVYVSPYFEA